MENGGIFKLSKSSKMLRKHTNAMVKQSLSRFRITAQTHWTISPIGWDGPIHTKETLQYITIYVPDRTHGELCTHLGLQVKQRGQLR